jgi:hypothetical protein
MRGLGTLTAGLLGGLLTVTVGPASAAGAMCSADLDCPTGYRCVNCACWDASACDCLEDADCADGEWCDRAACACVTTEPEPFDACPGEDGLGDTGCAQAGQGGTKWLGLFLGLGWLAFRRRRA